MIAGQRADLGSVAGTVALTRRGAMPDAAGDAVAAPDTDSRECVDEGKARWLEVDTVALCGGSAAGEPEPRSWPWTWRKSISATVLVSCNTVYFVF
jgi:hypothetical protein